MTTIHPGETARLVQWCLERWRAGEKVEGCVSRYAKPGTLVLVSTARLDGRGVLHMLVADRQEAVDAALRAIRKAVERAPTPETPQ
jgi:hypothetical protein